MAFEKQFLGLSKKLSASASAIATDPNPYVYLVNTDEVARLSSGITEFYVDGVAVAKIVRGDYQVAIGETANIIISTGKISVNVPFSGTIGRAACSESVEA